MGDLISVYIAHAGPEEDVTVLTSSRDGIQKQEDHFGRLQQHDTSDWNLIPYGYCTYRNRSDDGLFTFNVNKVADRGIVSKFYPVFETPECDADFLVAYLNSSQEIRKKLFVLAVGTSQVVLSYGALKELSLLLPQNREQSAIANVLNHIDNLITLHQRKRKYRGLYGYLSWEQRKLGDIAPVTMGQSPNGACYTDNPNDAVLVQGNADLKDGWVFPRVWTTEITKTAKAGDLIMSVRAPVGAMGKTAYDVVLGRGVAGIAGNEFLFQALSKKKAEGYWSTVSAGSTFDSINGDELRNTPVDYPRSKQEREAVGSCLSRIDCLITLHQ